MVKTAKNSSRAAGHRKKKLHRAEMEKLVLLDIELSRIFRAYREKVRTLFLGADGGTVRR
jgi:hypothetical protein